MTFWKQLDVRIKVTAAIAGSLMTIGGALWAGIAATSHVAKKALEGTFATKSDVTTCETTIKNFHKEDMANHLAWTAEHDKALAATVAAAVVDQLRAARYITRRGEHE